MSPFGRILMNTNPLEALPRQWREEAELLRRRGAIPLAECMESMAVDLESRIRAWLEEELPIHQASEESGYSEDHLRRLVRNEVLPDQRPPGSEGEIRVPLEPLRDERDRAIDDLFASARTYFGGQP